MVGSPTRWEALCILAFHRLVRVSCYRMIVLVTAVMIVDIVVLLQILSLARDIHLDKIH